MKIDELVKQTKPGQFVVYNKSLNWVAVTTTDHNDTTKNVRVFKMRDGELEELDYKVVRKTLIENIMQKVDADKLVRLVLTESIDTTCPDELFDLIERVNDKKGSIKEKPGCVELEVGGKRGRHMHFRIM